MRKIRRLVVLAVGAVGAYLLDPAAGHRRRARLAAKVKNLRGGGSKQTSPVIDDVTLLVVTDSQPTVPEPQVMDLT